MSSDRDSGKHTSLQNEGTDQHWRITEYVHNVQVENCAGPTTEEIAREHMKKEIEETNPDQFNFRNEIAGSSKSAIDMKIDLKKDAYPLKTIPRFISGYAGYIPGADRTYGLPFRKAVDAGAIAWDDAQDRLQLRTDETRHYAEMLDTEDLLARVRRENVDDEVDHGHRKKKLIFGSVMMHVNLHLQHSYKSGGGWSACLSRLLETKVNACRDVTAENPPTVGCAESEVIPCGGIALSERYARAAEDGLELLLMDRETKFDMAKNTAIADEPLVNAETQFDIDKNAADVHGFLDQAYLGATRHMRKTPEITHEKNTVAVHRGLDQAYLDATRHMRESPETAGTVHRGLDQAYLDATRHMREPFH